ncbi:hypothetical protein ACPCGZ_09235 [Propionibacteriaceae bacterium G1746]
MNRRQLLAGGVAALALVACQTRTDNGTTPPTTPATTPSPSTPPPSAPSTPATPAPSGWPLLTDKGEARKVVDDLQRTANLPVVKIDITATSATLSALDGRTPHAWRWTQGSISEVASDIEYIEQSTFDPAEFAFDDVGALFSTAAGISGSSSNQELQVVEQTPGSVLMVVTTRPESQPVFFRKDGSTVNRLEFTTLSGLDEALSDALAGRTQVTQVAFSKDALFAESPDPKDPQATLRITRQAKVPAFRTTRSETPTLDLFSTSDIDLEVILDQMLTLPTKWNKPKDSVVSWVVDRRDNRPLPTIRFTLDGRTVVTDLAGRDITKEI